MKMKIFRSLFLIQLVLLNLAIYKIEAVSNTRLAYRVFRKSLLNSLGRTMNNPKIFEKAKQLKRIQTPVPLSVEFPCRLSDSSKSKIKTNSNHLPWNEVRSKTRPTSVHALRPGDIDVIGAMGDSLTSGNGAAATNVLQTTVENRGLSWSIGGAGTWREFMTMPNILKEFNPNLIGYSLGDGLGFEKVTQFNTGESGGMSRDIPFMAKELIRRIKNDPRVDFENDWKLITIMIGPNDFCIDSCYRDNPLDSATDHQPELYTALMTLKNNLPRTLVNLVPAPNVELLKKLNNLPFICDLALIVECPCFFGKTNQHTWPMLSKVIKKWQEIDTTIHLMPEFHDKEDFTIVMQPFSLEVNLPLDKNGNSDLTFFSQDCFHFSQKGYAKAGNSLWNNMMQPVGNKTAGWWDINELVLCPTVKHPYIFTMKNSPK